MNKYTIENFDEQSVPKIAAAAGIAISVVLSATCLFAGRIGLAMFTLSATAASYSALRSLCNSSYKEEARRQRQRDAILASNTRDEAEFRMMLDRERLFNDYCKWNGEDNNDSK